MKTRRLLATIVLVLAGLYPVAAFAQSGDQWLTETQMKQISARARETGRVLSDLKCQFDDVPNPGRQNVMFQPTFVQGDGTIPWGWTFEANAPNPKADRQAKTIGFRLVSEDYFEITGVTWVRCKVWQR